MRKSIIKSLDFLIKDAIIVTEKVMEAIKLETINAAEGNCAHMLCTTSQDLHPSQSKKS